jgi:rhodanese-related sulfurtransferase
MGRFAVFALCFMLACEATPEGLGAPTGSTTPAAQIKTMEVQELASAITNKAPLRVIDVRTPGEFAGGHVPGAVNIPMDKLGAEIPRLKAEGGPEIALICEVGGRSAAAAEQFAKAGVPVTDILGGTSAWRRAGLPLE